LEYLDGGEINWQLDKEGKPALPISLARKYFRDVVLGLEYRKNFSFYLFIY